LEIPIGGRPPHQKILDPPVIRKIASIKFTINNEKLLLVVKIINKGQQTNHTKLEITSLIVGLLMIFFALLAYRNVLIVSA